MGLGNDLATIQFLRPALYFKVPEQSECKDNQIFCIFLSSQRIFLRVVVSCHFTALLHCTLVAFSTCFFDGLCKVFAETDAQEAAPTLYNPSKNKTFANNGQGDGIFLLSVVILVERLKAIRFQSLLVVN